MNNCLCNIFDNNCIWIIIIAILLLTCCNNGGSYNGNGCGGCGGYGYNNNGCGCSGPDCVRSAWSCLRSSSLSHEK